MWDFLFDYYPYSPGQLATWHPGAGVVLEGPGAEEYVRRSGYQDCADGVTADAKAVNRGRLRVAIAVLTGTASRPPALGCFGMHEWAMVYRMSPEQVRHPYLELRVPPAEIERAVDEVGLRCTHVDAYRFFTRQALPRNDFQPTRTSQSELEQPGCLHAAMDLYKYASWFAPMVGSDLIADCFENAARARELDMRASPYDVRGYGLEPIPVETAEGRREYVAGQRRVIAASAPLRARLLERLLDIRLAVSRDGRPADGSATARG